ncbi:MAG: PHP domain-containing protein [Clostridia bacterium]|nr:MAG: PHP domain-containing protein [Clostridia bacterium]
MVDLHVHTRASDGGRTPEQVVILAREAGLHALAITDHDTTDGLPPAQEAAGHLDLRLVPGIELSTLWDEHEVHILGYFIDPFNPELREVLSSRQEGRCRRGRRILEKLAALGMPLKWEEVLARAGDAASIGRPHIAEVMIDKGYVSSVDEAFVRFLGTGAPAYVPRTKFSPQEAIDLVLAAGGVPVLAHPGLIKDPALLEQLLQDGKLKGLEVYYPGHDEETTRELAELCRRQGLIATGGSDFHGLPGDDRAPLGTCAVSDVIVAALQQAAAG